MPTIVELEAQRAYFSDALIATNDLLKAMRNYESKLGSGLLAAAPAPAEAPSPATATVPPARRAHSAMQITEHMASKMMRETGRPITTGNVVDALRANGMSLHESNASNIVSARLSNSPLFTGRRGEGWWFANESWPGDSDADTKDAHAAALEHENEAERVGCRLNGSASELFSSSKGGGADESATTNLAS